MDRWINQWAAGDATWGLEREAWSSTISPKGIVWFWSRWKAPPYGEIHWPPPCCTNRPEQFLLDWYYKSMEQQAEREWMYVSHEHYRAALRSKYTTETVLHNEVMIISFLLEIFRLWANCVALAGNSAASKARNPRTPHRPKGEDQKNSGSISWDIFEKPNPALRMLIVYRSSTLFLESINVKLNPREFKGCWLCRNEVSLKRIFCFSLISGKENKPFRSWCIYEKPFHTLSYRWSYRTPVFIS